MCARQGFFGCNALQIMAVLVADNWEADGIGWIPIPATGEDWWRAIKRATSEIACYLERCHPGDTAGLALTVEYMPFDLTCKRQVEIAKRKWECPDNLNCILDWTGRRGKGDKIYGEE